MPQMSGLQLLRTLAHPPQIILTTAYSEFALKSYEYNVADYLLKPIEFARFLKAVDKVLVAQPREGAVSPDALPNPGTSFMVKVDGDWVRIMHDELVYGQSLGNYVKLFTTTQLYVTSLTMVELEQRLPANQFIRIHKSYLVSVDKILRLSGNEVLVGETIIPIGLTYRRELIERVR